MKKIILLSIFVVFSFDANSQTSNEEDVSTSDSIEREVDSILKLGDSLRHYGHYDKALLLGRQARELKPERYWPGLTQAYNILGFDALARENVLSRMKVTGEHPYARCVLMRLARKEGDREAVEKNLLAAQAIWPKDPELAASMWRCQYKAYTYLKEYDKALEYLNKIAPYVPEKDLKREFNIARAYLELKTGNRDRAEEYLTAVRQDAEKELQNSQDISRAHFDLTEVYALQEDYDAALELLREIRNFPFRDYTWLQVNPETQGLLNHPEGQQIMNEMKTEIDSLRERVLPIIQNKSK